MLLGTNLSSLEELYLKLSGCTNFKASQKIKAYAYFKKADDALLPPPRMVLSIANASKEFKNDPFNAEMFIQEGLKSLALNGCTVESVLFHYGREL